ncbi:MAG: dephospho-CoA kinase [candidate division Zixibacteria bacterium]|nr:dephospho-CoA kinase [Candidatus Tariuqbacter arcticus]
MKKALLIGLTGGIASGKTEAAEILRKLGAGVISADSIGKEVMENNPGMLEWVREEYGDEFFDHKGKLMRKKLGDFVFSHSDKKKILDERIFPPLYEKLKDTIAALSEKYSVIVVEAALLFEWGIESDFDLMVTVVSPVENVYDRLSDRDEFDNGQIRNRMESQIPPEEKAKRSSWVIHNDSTIKDLEFQIQRFWRVKVEPLTI